MNKAWLCWGGIFDWPQCLEELKAFNAQAESEDLWQNPSHAETLLRRRSRLAEAIECYQNLQKSLDDCRDFIALAEAENDQAALLDTAETLTNLRATAAEQQLQSLLSEEFDANNCYVEIHAGAGGTDAQDWVDMLWRMYARWSDRRGFTTSTVQQSAGEQAGSKSVTMKINGEYAYGWLKREQGTHRLVRISPFDSSARRHTSFASVSVYPDIEDDSEIIIADKDLVIDTYRASGAGGQHVNTTDSAVRITHLPTQTTVQCQNDRSQHKNKATAIKMLKAKLYQQQLQKRITEQKQSHQAKSDIAWGHQIRSYVLQPYQIVKDLRSQTESTQVQTVLDGDIDAFLKSALVASL